MWLLNREEELQLTGYFLLPQRKQNVQARNLAWHCFPRFHITIEEMERFGHLSSINWMEELLIGNFTNCLLNLRLISWAFPQPDFRAANVHIKNAVGFELSYNVFSDGQQTKSSDAEKTVLA